MTPQLEEAIGNAMRAKAIKEGHKSALPGVQPRNREDLARRYLAYRKQGFSQSEIA